MPTAGVGLLPSAQPTGSRVELFSHRNRMALATTLNPATGQESSEPWICEISQNLSGRCLEGLSWTLDSEGFHTGRQRGGVYSESMGGAVFPRDAPGGRLKS